MGRPDRELKKLDWETSKETNPKRLQWDRKVPWKRKKGIDAIEGTTHAYQFPIRMIVGFKRFTLQKWEMKPNNKPEKGRGWYQRVTKGAGNEMAGKQGKDLPSHQTNPNPDDCWLARETWKKARKKASRIPQKATTTHHQPLPLIIQRDKRVLNNHLRFRKRPEG